MGGETKVIESIIWILEETQESLMDKFGDETYREVRDLSEAILALNDILIGRY